MLINWFRLICWYLLPFITKQLVKKNNINKLKLEWKFNKTKNWQIQWWQRFAIYSRTRLILPAAISTATIYWLKCAEKRGARLLHSIPNANSNKKSPQSTLCLCCVLCLVAIMELHTVELFRWFVYLRVTYVWLWRGECRTIHLSDLVSIFLCVSGKKTIAFFSYLTSFFVWYKVQNSKNDKHQIPEITWFIIAQIYARDLKARGIFEHLHP